MDNKNHEAATETKPATSKLLPILALLEGSWKLYKQNFKKLFGMYLLSMVAVIGLAVVIGAVVAIGFVGGGHWYVTLLATLVFLAGLAGFIYYICRIQIALMLLIDKPETAFNTAFKESKEYFWSYLWVNVLLQLIMLGIFLVFALIAGITLATTGLGAFRSGDLTPVLSMVPFWILLAVLFVLAIIALAIYLGQSVFACIYEGAKGGQSLKRSFVMVKGNWWAVFWRYLALMLLFYLALIIISIPSTVTPDSAFGIFWGVLVRIATLLVSPLFIVYYYFLFRDLQKLKK